MNEPIPPSDPEEKLFGEMLVKEGLVKPEQVRECFVLQDELRAREVSPLPKLGELLRQKGYLTPEAYQETVTLGVRPEQIESEFLEEVPLPPEVVEAVQKEENRFGKYVRVAPLGSGGMGEVWKAWDTDLGRWVALKFLKSSQPEDLLRFRREAHTAGQLNHPHIAAIYEVGVKEGSPFIAMQYVEGQTLSTFPSKDLREKVLLLRDTARTIHAAHEQGIIHRDLKPANIMVAEKEGPHIYVMDFGLARETAVDTSISQSGLVIGSPAYMSPEQAQGKAKHLDARSDVYSLGVTLYELCTGAPPFESSEVIELLRKVVEDDPEPLRKRNPKVDPDLESIVLKCLRKEREKRYPTAQAFVDDLEHYLAGDSIQALPIDPVEKTSRWVKKNRAQTGVLLAIFLLLLAGGAYFLLEPQWKKAHTITKVNEVLDRVRSGYELADPKKREKVRNELLAYRNRETVKKLSDELDLLTDSLAQNGKLEEEQERYLSLLCETLGLLGISDGAVAALGRYLGAEKIEKQLRAVPAGKALCLLNSKTADEWLIKARFKFGINRPFWLQVKEAFLRKEVVLDLESDSALGYLRRGTLKWEKGDIDGAIEDFNRALQRNPRETMAWNNRGLARKTEGDLDGAITDFTQAIQLAPNQSDPWNNRALTWQAKGEYEKAIRDFNQALERNPRNAVYFANRGNVLYLQKDSAGAIADYSRAIELNPEFAGIFASRGNVWHSQGNLEKAISDYTRALELNPKLGKTWGSRAIALHGKGEWDRAISDYTQALEFEHKNITLWNNRGLIRAVQQDLDGAILDFTRAIGIDAEMESAWMNRGLAWHKKGNRSQAISDYNQSLLINPDLVPALLNRGFARKEMGNFPGAISDWNKVVKLAPAHPQAPGIRAGINEMRVHLEKQKEK